MINKRIFGAPIPINVQKKLEARQLAAVGDKKPLDEINSNYTDEKNKYNELISSNFDMEADLSSRTPFARMWTGISLVNEREFVINKQEDDTNSENDSIESTTKSKDDLDNITKIISQIKFKELERTIYVVGTNNISTVDNSLNPNNNQQSNLHQAIFPPEHGVEGDKNKFLKPQAGITSVSSETEGIMGSIKKTEVKFIIHNFHDFDKIYSRFFLRPGAQIFVDFGWDALKDSSGNKIKLYDPRDILNLKSRDNQLANDEKVEHKLFGEKDRDDGVDEDGFVTTCNGDVETIVGIVTNYSSKVLPNGTVECSVTITSKNSALMLYPKQIGENTQNSVAQFEFDLDNLIFYEQAYNLGSKADQGSLKEAVDKITNSTNSVEDELSFDSFLTSMKIRSFGGKTFIPTAMAQISGLFIPGSHDTEDGYMSWGFFEDRILNRYFGHGDSAESIIDNTKGNFSVKIDSSDAFTAFEPGFLDKQRQMSDATTFVVPTNWDLSYNNMRDGKPPKAGYNDIQRQHEMLVKPKLNEDGESSAVYHDPKRFDSKVKKDKERIQKFIEERYETGDAEGDDFKEKSKVIEVDGLITKYDKLSKRVPLREVFVNIKVIKKALKNENNTTFRDVVQEVLDEINDDAYGLWDWKLVGEENVLKVNDMNYSETATGNKDERKNEFEKLFKFEIMSKNSIVTNYETSFEMPDGDVGSMYAIEAMTGTPAKMNPISKIIESYSALLSISSKYDIKKVGFRYLPDMGAYNALNADNSNFNKTKKLKYYNDIQTSFQNDKDKKTSYGIGIGVVPPSQVWTSAAQDKAEKKKKNQDVEVDYNVKARNAAQAKAITDRGDRVVDNMDDYWNHKVTGEFVTEDHFKAIPLPMKLEITTYGISSLKPGDIFRVDYLPEIYMKYVYFQVINVSHQIDSNGWYTSLETQFRISPHRYEDSNMNTAPGEGTDEESANLRKELEEANMNIDSSDINNVVNNVVLKSNNQNSGDMGNGYFTGNQLTGADLLSVDIDDKKAYMWDTDAKAPSTNYRSAITDTNIKNKYWQRMNKGSLKPYANDWSSGYWDYVKGTMKGTLPFAEKANIYKYPDIVGEPVEHVGETAKDVLLIDSFKNLKGFLTNIVPLNETNYNNFKRLFLCEVFGDYPIYVANPLYLWDKGLNRNNGYGSGPNTYHHNKKDTYQGGVYWPGEKVYLIINKQNPSRFWALIPANPNSKTTLEMMDCSVEDPNWGVEEWERESDGNPSKY